MRKRLATLSMMTSLGTVLGALILLASGSLWSQGAASWLTRQAEGFRAFNRAAEAELSMVRESLFKGQTKPRLDGQTKPRPEGPTKPRRRAPDRFVHASIKPPIGGLLKEYPEALWLPALPPERWSPKEIADGLKVCLKALASIEAEVEPLPPIREGACGTAAPVKLRSLGGKLKVAFKPPATINCQMAVAMERWLEEAVQPAARAAFGSPVAQIVGSSYACRNVYNRDTGRLSQHAYGNAFDLPTFVLANGRRVHVVLGWGSTARDEKPRLIPVVAKPASQTNDHEENGIQPQQERTDTAEAKFLRRVHKEACGVFSTVLGPEMDNVHRDHFHLDLQSRGSADVCQ